MLRPATTLEKTTRRNAKEKQIGKVNKFPSPKDNCSAVCRTKDKLKFQLTIGNVSDLLRGLRSLGGINSFSDLFFLFLPSRCDVILFHCFFSKTTTLLFGCNNNVVNSSDYLRLVLKFRCTHRRRRRAYHELDSSGLLLIIVLQSTYNFVHTFRRAKSSGHRRRQQQNYRTQ